MTPSSSVVRALRHAPRTASARSKSGLVQARCTAAALALFFAVLVPAQSQPTSVDSASQNRHLEIDAFDGQMAASPSVQRALAAGGFGNFDVNSSRGFAGLDPGYSDLPRFMADVNSDGRADFCRFVGNDPGRFLSCAVAKSGGTFGNYDVNSRPGFAGLDPGYSDLPRFMADVDGDGRADYCRFVGNDPARFFSCAVAKSGGTFGNYEVNSRPGFAGFDPGYSDLPRFMADADGDGRADYCRFVGNDPARFLSCAAAESGGTFGNYDVNSRPGFAGLDPGYSDLPRFMADADGDGRADYCRFVGNDPARFFSCAAAKPGGTFGNYDVNSRRGFAGFDPGYSDLPRFMADVNGDGRADYCRFVGDDPARFFSCALATPAKRFGNYDVNSSPGTSGFHPGNVSLPRLMADANGDSRADYCRFVGRNDNRFLTCAAAKPPGLPAGVPDFSGVIFSPKIENIIGTRRVVAILWDPHRPDHPAPPASAIDELLFGANPSVRDWYRENSGSRLDLVREAVPGWYSSDKPGDHYWDNGPDDGSDPGYHDRKYHDGWLNGHVEKWAEAIRKADVEFDFSGYDVNLDGILDPQELAILIVIPQRDPFGTNRPPAGRQVPSFEPLIVDGVSIPWIAEWYTGSPSNLGAPAHELSHLLIGTPDLYMNWLPWPFAAHAYSIMDISYSTTHFDPFVKLKSGWLSYRVVSRSGNFSLRSVETTREALVLYDPIRGPGEYFLVENRWRGTSYDAGRLGAGSGLPADGVAVWHIIEDPALLALSNPPIGGPGEWGRRGIRLIRANGGVPEDDSLALLNRRGATLGDFTTPARLRWVDGSETGFTIKLRTGPGELVRLEVDVDR